MKITASATAIVTVEMRGVGSYGQDWTVEQIHLQVAKEVRVAILDKFPTAKIIGEPVVKFCTFEVNK